MKKFLFAAITAAALFSSASAQAGVWVQGYGGPYYQPTCTMMWTAFGWQQVCG